MGNSAQVVRLPYTAEYKILSVKTLANGTTITHESTKLIALDSQGRRMTSSKSTPLEADREPVTRVNVSDPVARTNSSWSVPGDKATVMLLLAPGRSLPSCGRAMATTSGPEPRTDGTGMVVEDLGKETNQGVEARGRRTTSTRPTGAMGTDEPQAATVEMWTAVAPGLRGMVVRSVINLPQSGKTSTELVSFSQEEPDPSLFQPPPGYEIVNQESADCGAPAARREQPEP